MSPAVQTERRPAPTATRVPVACEVSAVTPDLRPCTVRYIAGGEIVSIWVPRFGDRTSESFDRMALVAREWLSWARNEAARDEEYRGRP